MDKIIEYFIENSFSEEMQAEIYLSFDLFDAFDYKLAYEGFMDILTYTDDITNDDVRDKFLLELHSKLDYVINEHTIQLVEDVTVTQKNQLLLAMKAILDLEDTTPIIRMLESLETDDEKLATIVSDLSELDKTDVLMIVESFEPSLLNKLKDFIYSKEELLVGAPNDNTAIIRNLRAFFKEYGHDSIGYTLSTNDVMLGQDFNIYLDYVKDAIVTADDKLTAQNILSLIYMTNEGVTNALGIYHEHSADILTDLNKISKIEVLIMQMVNKVNEIVSTRIASDKSQQVIIPTEIK